jgi:hypothetical protein
LHRRRSPTHAGALEIRRHPTTQARGARRLLWFDVNMLLKAVQNK